MKKFLLFISIIIIVLAIFLCLQRNSNKLNKNLSNVALSSTIYDKNTVLTKHDVAVWFMNISNYVENYDNELNDYSDEKRSRLFKEAVDLGIIQGPNSLVLDDEKLCTREEAFVMIKRAFKIASTDRTIPEQYQDATEVSPWAQEAVEDILNIVFESEQVFIFDDGLRPKEHITQKDIVNILDPILESDYNGLIKMTWREKLFRFVDRLNKIRTILGITIIAIILFIFRYIHHIYIKYKTKKEIIYIGDMASGKTVLSKVLPNEYCVRKKATYIPTRGVRNADSVLVRDNSGYIRFHGTAIDIPGGSNEALLTLLRKKTLRDSGKILILILAHTESGDISDIEEEYLKEQYDRIDKVYIPAINAFRKKISKIIVFINKCDILPTEYQSDWDKTQETIYERHLALLENKTGMDIDVITGSATRRININVLLNLLICI